MSESESNWRRALRARDLEQLRQVLRLAYDFRERTGRELSPEELHAMLEQPRCSA